MTQQVNAVYENGVLRPLGPVNLSEQQEVQITIIDATPGFSQRDDEFLATTRAQVAAADRIPTLEEVRQVVKGMPGSLSQTIIDEREDRS